MTYLRATLVVPLVLTLLQPPPISSQTQTSAPPSGTTSTASKLAIQDGTPVKLRLSRNVSSADAKTGDTVDFEVLEEIRVSDTLVIPKGGIAWGTVTNAEHKKRMARGGKLDMTIDSVRLLDGEKAALRAVKEAKGGGHTGAMTGGMIATSLIVWPAAPLFLFMHGKDITIPKGTEITAYINGDYPVDQQKFRSATPSAAPVPAPAPSAATATSQASLEITSTPAGADVELDGSFVGNTPSSVGVAEGEHTLKISKSGFKPWERKVRTSTGTVKVEAELEKDVVTPPANQTPPEQK